MMNNINGYHKIYDIENLLKEKIHEGLTIFDTKTDQEQSVCTYLEEITFHTSYDNFKNYTIVCDFQIRWKLWFENHPCNENYIILRVADDRLKEYSIFYIENPLKSKISMLLRVFESYDVRNINSDRVYSEICDYNLVKLVKKMLTG